MSKILFDDEQEEDICFKTDNEYANKYNTWRQKEEINKLQTKYGADAKLNYTENNEDSSSSSDDDEAAVEFTENVEKDFYKTLALLKKKDPKIYDKNIKFFEQTDNAEANKKKKHKKAVYLNDYERNLLLEKGGVFSESEDENDANVRSYSPTYAEEQKKLKDSFKNVLNSDDEDDNWGGIFQKRQQSKEDKMKEEEAYKEWLKGQKEDIDDKDTAEQLKPLKEFWNDPKLDKNEKFLRDYILNKRFLDENDEDHIPTYEEIVHDSDENLSEDEKAIEIQEEFEHKYNFRFEEPDQEFVKRYPRTMENSLRKTDDRRKLKRAEIKERKEEVKKQKKEELKQLKALKRKEIEDKIEKLREITGDSNLGFQDADLDDDFDPESYDKRMQQLFNDDYYKDEEIQKPEYPDIDEELEIENWDKWHKEQFQGSLCDPDSITGETSTPHCEDEDFNMDCDYNPESVQKELLENCRSKKKRKSRQSKFANAVATKKPVFDPKDTTYQQYIDEYYRLDYEDMIGDTPCRFKYRSVVPNDFGLSVEEILMANDRELNKWCSLKKAIQHRPEHVEKYEVIAYSKKGQNEELKRKALPSLFQTLADVENDSEVDVNRVNAKNTMETQPKVNEEEENELQESEEEELNEKRPRKVKKHVAENKVLVKKQIELQESREEELNEKSPRKVKKQVAENKALVKKQIELPESREEELNEKPLRKVKKHMAENKTLVKTQEIQLQESGKEDSHEKVREVEENKSVEKKKRRQRKKKSAVQSDQEVKSIESEEKSIPKVANLIVSTSGCSLIGKRRRKRKMSTANSSSDRTVPKRQKMENLIHATNLKKGLKKNNKQQKGTKRFNSNGEKEINISDARLEAFGINPKKYKNKMKYGCKKQ